MVATINSKNEMVMIDIDHIYSLKWTSQQALTLQALRGEMSRRYLSEVTENLGHKITHQYIQQLEQPHIFVRRLKSDNLTVSVEVVQVLCKAFKVDISAFFNSAKIFNNYM
ncbi:hypothetical protein DSM106972_051260 [Dulcicalothrix desertica PCC 7102]|uniref:HTH cro/C1-type domain-containing protein n=1 Tax=Dulcicalothrix desertica PCC 7102 TaxID=232991 RepID=A0A3S1CKP2_9CYAN|nr:hypothetical protein [Dulcicalothrix desertica]RUT03487.1 hypothetical protein DSM106972_051260 [Dulcicalothrix desertica PCC 7102]TWH50589.1 hypothetical protein CAL7102_04914 [Dulcicalothrix desertica PCC 7102]